MTQNKLDPIAQFAQERREEIATYKDNKEWKDISARWLEQAFAHKYMYNFAWLGRPIIQLPADMVAFQEIVWAVKPDLIVEAGIAHGGSLILSASMLALIDYCEAIENGTVIDPKKPKRRVVGIDIDIRDHNARAIQAHPLANRIDMVEGSSIEQSTIDKVYAAAAGYKNVMLCLDSNHTHDHVLEELRAYAPLVSKGNYCIVFDTLVEDLPEDTFPDRPWSPGNNPKTALYAYLKEIKAKPMKGTDNQPLNFEIDSEYEQKLLLNVTPDGFLKRV